MGLKESRELIVDLEEVTENRTVKFYLNDTDNKNNTVFTDFAQKHERLFEILLEVVRLRLGEPIQALEVGAGDGRNSKILKNKMKRLKGENYIATDLIAHPNPQCEILTPLPSEEAVKKYGDVTNLLVLIAPLPNCYVDYYAIKEFETINKKQKKYVLYVGELGASDGGEGMYQYMLHKSSWKLLYRKLLFRGRDMLMGPIEKEIFLFEWRCPSEEETLNP